MKQFQKLLWGAAIVVYGVWAYTGPVEILAKRYGDSGLTWGVLVFGLLIPYTVYIIWSLFQSGEKGKQRDSDIEE